MPSLFPWKSAVFQRLIIWVVPSAESKGITGFLFAALDFCGWDRVSVAAKIPEVAITGELRQPLAEPDDNARKATWGGQPAEGDRMITAAALSDE